MQILVYGAGVIGCELAHVLCRAGQNVTLLARGPWKETIKQKGLCIRHYAQMRTTVDHPRVIGKLNAEDEYDLIFVTLQYCHVAEALPALAANCSRRIVLVGNNMEAREALLALEQDNADRAVAFGFQSTGGRREGSRVVSIHLHPAMTLGGLDAPISDDFKTLLQRAFDGARYQLKWEDRMDAWLKSHLAYILPICYVCYATGGVLRRANESQLNNIIDATIEAHAMLKQLGYPIRPDGEEAFFTENRKKCMSFLRLMAHTPIGKLAASDHAMHAVGEMQALDAAFEKLRDRAGVPMPAWERLRTGGNPQEMETQAV
jgi:2-dehydropantoate 2-reductase